MSKDEKIKKMEEELAHALLCIDYTTEDIEKIKEIKRQKAEARKVRNFKYERKYS